jgi:hypothetical protein
VGDGEYVMLVRRMRMLDPVDAAGAAAVLESVAREHPAPADSIGQSGLCLITADRAQHESLARSVLATIVPGQPVFLVGGELPEPGATLWRGPEPQRLIVLADSVDVLMGWAYRVLCHVESQWHVVMQKRNEYACNARVNLGELGESLEERMDEACQSLAVEKRGATQRPGRFSARVFRRIRAWFSGRGADPLDSPAFEATAESRFHVSNEADHATSQRVELEFYRENLAGFLTLVGTCPGAAVIAARLHEADLALEMIRLDVASLEPKLKRADWVLEGQRTGLQLREEKRREQWDRVVKCVGLPVAFVQILVGGIQLCIGALTLGEKIPELQPWRWIIVASGVVSVAFGLGLLLYAVWRALPQQPKEPPAREVPD